MEQQKIYGIIYKATNKINGKIYIGQTTETLNKRISHHLHSSLNRRDNTYFHNAIRKYSKENFVWKIIAECYSKEELNKAETEIIKRYNDIDKGYNLTEGGGGNVGFRHSKETKKKMSKAQKGEKHPNYGKHLTEKTRKKISESQKGKRHCFYGKHLTEDHKKKIGDGNKGKKLLEKTKKRISKSNSKKYIVTTPKGDKISVFGLRGFCRNYTKEKLNSGNLIKVAKGKLKQCKGYKCEYFIE